MKDDPNFDGLWSLGRFYAEDGPALVRFRPRPSDRFVRMWPKQFVVEWRLERSRSAEDRDKDPAWSAFEKELVRALERGNQACLAFVVTASQYREWYFYCGDLLEMQGRFNREVARRRDLPVSLHVGDDPHWDVYDEFVGPFLPGRA